VAILFAIAIYKSLAIKGQDDFVVAGRSVSTFFLVGTLICTWIGSGSLFGSAGLAFRAGISELWMSAGAWIGIIIVYFLVPKVHKLAQYTVSDILEKRYNQYARILGTITIIIAYMAIAGYQFKGGGRLLNLLIPELDPFYGQLLTMGIAVVFTLLAGMLSIVALDIFNGIIMILGIMIAFPLLLWQFGGVQPVVDQLPSTHLQVFGDKDFYWAIGVFFPTFFLLLGESSMYQKFFAAKSERSARNAVLGMVVGVMALETVLTLVSIVGRALYNTSPVYTNIVASGDPEKISKFGETIILQLAVHNLPLWAGALLMCAGVAIILSTATTFLMIASTNITHDLYHRFLDKKASQRKLVWFQRCLIAVLGGVSLLLLAKFQSILAMALYAYTMVGAGITPALLAALLWKRATPAGGVASIAAGMITTIVFAITQSWMQRIYPWWDYEYIIYPAAIASIFCLIVVSLCTQDKEKKYQQFFPDPTQTPQLTQAGQG